MGGDLVSQKGTSISGNINVSMQLSARGPSSFGSALSSFGSVNSGGSLSIRRRITVSDRLSSSGASFFGASTSTSFLASFGNSCSITSGIMTGGGLQCANALMGQSTCSISGRSHMSKLAVYDDILASSSLSITGDSVFGSSVSVATLAVGNIGSIRGQLHVGSSLSVGSTTRLGGSSQFSIRFSGVIQAYRPRDPWLWAGVSLLHRIQC